MSQSSSNPPPNDATSPAARLEQHLRSKSCIAYEENLKDREYPFVTCSIYGAPKTNELFVRLTNGQISFVDVTQSPLLYPAMADRIFGMDVADSQVAFGLAEKLWEKHRDELLGAPQP
ncbi:hypothetical protein DB347_20370 [Opitutaceae bacterium EW11]|nr:hypothetical protein DB347_20370 [Opitutaceae bacterium EW11]